MIVLQIAQLESANPMLNVLANGGEPGQEGQLANIGLPYTPAGPGLKGLSLSDAWESNNTHQEMNDLNMWNWVAMVLMLFAILFALSVITKWFRKSVYG